MTTKYNTEERSQEVQEILTRPPRGLIRYGTLVVCAILALLIGAAFFFQYPDIVSATAVIVSDESEEVKAILSVDVQDYSKLEVGQIVKIKVTGYPHTKFGTLEGRIGEISTPSGDDRIQVLTHIDPELVTSTGFKIDFSGELRGLTDIITENRSLMARIFSPMKN